MLSNSSASTFSHLKSSTSRLNLRRKFINSRSTVNKYISFNSPANYLTSFHNTHFTSFHSLHSSCSRNFSSSSLKTASKHSNSNDSEQIESDSENVSSSDSINSFSSLGIRPSLVEGLQKCFSISNPTEIQELAIKTLIKYNNRYTIDSSNSNNNETIKAKHSNPNPVLIASQTGSGKSLSYLLPLIEILKRSEESTKHLNNTNKTRISRPKSIILVPNRELTYQLLHVCKQLSYYGKYRSEAISGGELKKKQLRDLNGPIDILIATPGRLLQYIEDDVILLTDCKFMVIDEADTMLTEKNGFLPILDKIFNPIKERIKKSSTNNSNSNNNNANSSYLNTTPCQFILSTASVPPIIEPILKIEFPSLTRLNSTTLHRLPQQLIQQFVSVGNQNKLYVLLELLKKEQQEYKKLNKNNSNNDNNSNNLVSIDHKKLKGLDDEEDKISDSISSSNQQLHLLGPRSAGSIDNTPNSSNSSNNPNLIPTLPPTLIFCNTIDSCRVVEYFLRENGFNLSSYHGEIPPKQREINFRSFLYGHNSILLSTDMGSRGLDTKGVSHVIQFDMALNPVDYLHRVGRTARIGNKGKATALITKGDNVLSKAIINAFQSNQPITTLSSDKNDYLIEKPLIPSIMRNNHRIRPLYQNLGINPNLINNSSIEKVTRIQKKQGIPSTLQPLNPLIKTNTKWSRYQTKPQQLKEKITNSIAKQKRLFEEKTNFRLRVVKLSENERNKLGKKSKNKSDSGEITKGKVKDYYKKMGLGKGTK